MNEDVLGGLYDGTYRAKWLRSVIASVQITDAIRVLLMTLALHMDPTGRVSVPREDLAKLLGRNPRKVAEKMKTAFESGFLIQVARGQKHQTAVYQAAVDGQTLSVLPVGHPEPDLRMPHGGPTEDSQGAGSPDSQGATDRHPEPQGADFRVSPGGHAENSQGAPRGSSQSFIDVEVSEEVDLSDADSLFDVEAAASRPVDIEKSTKRKTKISKSFTISPEMRVWAAEKVPSVDIDFETEQFIDHWSGKGELRLDWVACWRTWMRNQQKWNAPRHQRMDGRSSPGKTPNGSGPDVPQDRRSYSENPRDYR